MRITVWILMIFVVVVGAFLIIDKRNQNTSLPITYPSSSPTQTAQNSFCDPNDLSATVELSPGAGNVYGTFKLTNNSPKTCKIQGGNVIQASYDKNTVKNISISYLGTPPDSEFSLASKQSLYSQVHYPNGPQCQGPANQTKVQFSYEVSDGKSVTFKNMGNNYQTVATCQSEHEFTQIQLWNISTTPITPQ